MKRSIVLLILLTSLSYGCSSTRQMGREQPEPNPTEDTTQAEAIDFSLLLEPPKDWHHLDEAQSQFRGISSRRAHDFLLKNKSPQKKVVVAVIDGGIDADHEDLKQSMWVNSDEIPGNEVDDDQNGYVDDIHGWNFIGGPDGENVNHDTFELARIYSRLHADFAGADTTQMNEEQREKYARYREIRTAYEKEINDLLSQYNNVQSLKQSMNEAREILDEYFASKDYGYEDIKNLQPSSRNQQFAKSVMIHVLENSIDSALIADQKEQIYNFAKYGYNPDFSPRSIVGDNYEDKNERYYGNNDVAGPDPTHGTHVAGIIAAARGNEIGIDGISANTRIMAVRAVPNGDERDKDVANAIRYAVDNGTDVINMSFGKSYSPYKKVVDRAIKYAEKNGVLMVHGAGNEAKDIDEKPSYPTDRFDEGGMATKWLSVGASSWKPNNEFVAGFTNYGAKNVDLFAPGVDIYSTMPDNSYTFQDGTSMASPVVAGVTALIMAYYPELNAQQVRQLIMDNTVNYARQQVILPNQQGADRPLVEFGTLSASGGVVNAYNALKAAEQVVSEK